eukprot:10099869-Lingulodinium_polyedra.AAC.1
MAEVKGIFGPPGTEGAVQSIRSLNRIPAWDADVHPMGARPAPRGMHRGGRRSQWQNQHSAN